MESGLFLDVVIAECATILKLLASVDQTLQVSGDSFLVLDHGFHSYNCVLGGYVKGEGLSMDVLDENLHVWHLASSCGNDDCLSVFQLEIITLIWKFIYRDKFKYLDELINPDFY